MTTSAFDRTRVFPVLLVNFIGTLGFSIVIPFLVFLVTRFGGNAVIYGIVGASYPAFQLVGAPLLGAWSDRYGRRRVLLLSQVGTLISWAIFSVALFLPVTPLIDVDSGWGSFTITVPLLILFAARALDGLTGGNISVANAYLADVTPETDRSRNFGRMGVSTNLGFVLGPALAGLLGATVYGEVLPVFAALGISLIAALVILFVLPESPASESDPPPRDGTRRALGQEPVDCTEVDESRRIGLGTCVRRRAIRRMLVLYFLVFLGFSFFYVAFPVRAATDLGWTVGQTGVFFSVLSVLMVLVQGPLLTRLSPVFQERSLVVSGSIFLTLSFSLLTSDSVPILYLAAALFALGNGTMWPSIQAILSRTAPPELQGATQGFAGAAGSLASIVGMLTGGLLFQHVGASTFLVAGGTLLLVATLATLWLPSAGVSRN
ncbi:MAG: MFS transporter [bacterium]|nr:MFS transporter [bacterium]